MDETANAGEERAISQETATADAEARLYVGRSTIAPRLINAMFTTAVTAFWTHWWALAWFAAYAAFEFFFSPWFQERLIAPHVARGDLDGARRKGAILIGIGATLFALSWVGAWVRGGPEAGFIAGMFLAGTMMHGVIYFSSARISFFACIAPALAAALIAPFLLGQNLMLIAVTLLGLIHNGVHVWSARKSRNAMMSHLWNVRSEMQAARDASVAKSQFLATMSHELRTPLNAVIGYAEILEEDLADEGMAEQAEDAARIRRSARDLLLLINEILDFSKIEAGKMEVQLGLANIDEIVRDVLETTAHLAQAHNNTIKVEIGEGANEIVTDAQRLRQCLLNLVSNACKFTDDGAIEIRVALEAQQGMLRLEVSDSGCGISEGDLSRLFQPFVQGDGSFTRRKGGTGLGLVITKKFAQLLGGDVSAESTLHVGSTFTLRVRAHPRQILASEQMDGPAVLVIEDEESARDLFRRALARLPFHVIEAQTASEGFARAKAQAPALIVLDIHLPDRSGWELLAELKANPAIQNIPVLVVSVDDDRVKAMRLGACDHLVKPVDRERLASAVLRFALAEAPKITPQEAPAHTQVA